MVLTTLDGTIVVVYLIHASICAENNDVLLAQMMATALFMGGICTFLMVTFGVRYVFSFHHQALEVRTPISLACCLQVENTRIAATRYQAYFCAVLCTIESWRRRCHPTPSRPRTLPVRPRPNFWVPLTGYRCTKEAQKRSYLLFWPWWRQTPGNVLILFPSQVLNRIVAQRNRQDQKSGPEILKICWGLTRMKFLFAFAASLKLKMKMMFACWHLCSKRISLSKQVQLNLHWDGRTVHKGWLFALHSSGVFPNKKTLTSFLFVHSTAGDTNLTSTMVALVDGEEPWRIRLQEVRTDSIRTHRLLSDSHIIPQLPTPAHLSKTLLFSSSYLCTEHTLENPCNHTNS